MKALIKKVIPARARRFVKDVAQMAVYATPSATNTSVQLSPAARSWLATLRRDGIVKIEGNPDFERVASYVEETYFKQIESNPTQFLGASGPSYPFRDRERFIWDTNRERDMKAGTDVCCSISFLDRDCAPLFLNDDLSCVLLKYYARQPYYRNQPVIQKVALKSGQAPLANGLFHVDHLRQISVMLLVSDVTESDTHMEFCEGSHKRNLLREGIELTREECKSKFSPYPVFKCIGRKGTLFVFDTSGFHRANYIANSTRKILHLNVNTGHHLEPFIDRKSSFTTLSRAPIYVRRMFEHLNA